MILGGYLQGREYKQYSQTMVIVGRNYSCGKHKHEIRTFVADGKECTEEQELRILVAG